MSAKIKGLLAEACDNIGDVSLREYSGRGMYGKKCMAVTGSIDACQRVIAEVLKAAADEAITIAHDADDDNAYQASLTTTSDLMSMIDSLVTFSWDNMGLDYVVYWPDIEWVEDEPEPLPTDEQINQMTTMQQYALLRDHWADYVLEDDNLAISNLTVLVKRVRYRVAEDREELREDRHGDCMRGTRD